MASQQIQFLVSLIILIVQLIQPNLCQITPRIVGGRTTTISNRQYMLIVRIDGEFKCGASLIASNFALTAAHCVKGISPRRVTVTGGATRLSETGVLRNVTEVIAPGAFTATTMDRDVAVLKLNDTMTGPNIRTIGLCNAPLTAGRTATISGWGTTSQNSRTASDQLRTVNLILMSKNECKTRFLNAATLSRSMICASVLGRKDSCAGDSGGPLVYNNRVCGIVSWGIGCGSSKYPGIYTSVNEMKRFINNALLQ